MYNVYRRVFHKPRSNGYVFVVSVVTVIASVQARQRSTKFLNAVGCGERTAGSQTGDQLLKCLRRLDAGFILNNEWVQSDFMARLCLSLSAIE